MGKGRLEAFSDGVIAILITIMVLELKAPHEGGLSGLAPLIPALSSYALSFLFLAIYWNNHHHLLQAVKQVDGRVLWANVFLLFWLSLVPFLTSWMGESHFSAWPVALYGADLLMAGLGYYLLVRALISAHPSNAALAKAIGRDFKGKISLLLYALGMCLSFHATVFSVAIYVFVAAMWLIPDQRIEKVLAQ